MQAKNYGSAEISRVGKAIEAAAKRRWQVRPQEHRQKIQKNYKRFQAPSDKRFDQKGGQEGYGMCGIQGMCSI
jgi:hypothetical protein